MAVCTLINFGYYFGYNSLPRLPLPSLLACSDVLLFWDLDVREGSTQFRNVYTLSYDQEYYPKSQSSCFFMVVKSQVRHPILENITLDRTDAFSCWLDCRPSCYFVAGTLLLISCSRYGPPSKSICKSNVLGWDPLREKAEVIDGRFQD